MNLYRLDALIAQLIAEHDDSNAELIAFYYRKRTELVAEIARKVQAGLRLV